MGPDLLCGQEQPHRLLQFVLDTCHVEVLVQTCGIEVEYNNFGQTHNRQSYSVSNLGLVPRPHRVGLHGLGARLVLPQDIDNQLGVLGYTAPRRVAVTPMTIENGVTYHNSV